jgi:hypothetical protein
MQYAEPIRQLDVNVLVCKGQHRGFRDSHATSNKRPLSHELSATACRDGTVADSCPSPASCANAYAIGSAVRGMPPRSSGSSAAHWPDRARRPGLAHWPSAAYALHLDADVSEDESPRVSAESSPPAASAASLPPQGLLNAVCATPPPTERTNCFSNPLARDRRAALSRDA